MMIAAPRGCCLALTAMLVFAGCAGDANRAGAQRGVAVDLANSGHAELSDSPLSLQNRLRWPSSLLDREGATVRCSAAVDQRGQVFSNLCRAERLDARRYAAMVEQAARGARLKPGSLNGQLRDTAFNYTVRFENRNGLRSIGLWLHHNLDSDDTAGRFVGVQRVTCGQQLEQACSQRMLHTLEVRVNADGRVGGVALISGESEETCVEATMELARSCVYLPALDNGVPVDGRFRWLFYGSVDRVPTSPTGGA